MTDQEIKPDCDECNDGELYPYYGVAPHTHKTDPIIGSTVLNDKATWPENFFPDGEDASCGVYVCPKCKGNFGAPDSQREG